MPVIRPFLVTRITLQRIQLCYRSSVSSNVRKKEWTTRRWSAGEVGEYRARLCETDGGTVVARALRNHNVWLALAYVGLILLMARTYA